MQGLVIDAIVREIPMAIMPPYESEVSRVIGIDVRPIAPNWSSITDELKRAVTDALYSVEDL